MEIKRKRCLFSLTFSAFMILMIFALYKPLEVQAARTMPHRSEGRIYVRTGDESGSGGYEYFKASSGKILKKTKGLSYNKKTNTLTIDNFNHPGWWILAKDMGDFKVVAKGTSKFAGINNKNSLIWTNTLTIDGSGKLVLKGAAPCLACDGTTASITIGKNVTINASATASSSVMFVRRNGKISGNKVFKISGNYSSGSVKRSSTTFSHLGSCYQYYWSKSTFKKTGKSGSSSSSKKPAKMAFSSSGKTTKYDHGIYVKWNKVTKNAKGYQLQISADSSFNNLLVNRTMSTDTVRFDYGYSQGYTLYVRIRAYNKVSGSTIYGSWSAVKTFTVE
jgi:hypothetical protein